METQASKVLNMKETKIFQRAGNGEWDEINLLEVKESSTRFSLRERPLDSVRAPCKDNQT